MLSYTLIDPEIDGMAFPEITLTELTALYKIHEARKINKLIKSLVKCYLVKAEIKDARSRKGIRASLFKMAQEFQAFYYHHDESQSICYNDADLKVTLLFESKKEAGDFRNSLTLWQYNNPMAAKGLVISVDRSVNVIYTEVSKLKEVMLEDYRVTETDSPVQSLEEFEGHVSSCSSIGVVSTSEPLFKFQSIEKPESFIYCKPYKMHIKPKA